MKSAKEIASIAVKKVEMIILQELPRPECASKIQQWNWKKDEVRTRVAQALGGSGVNVIVKL